jgi:hypothetical protein
MTDNRWRQVAEHVLAKTGLAPTGDTRAVRWIAMRHGPEHIHIVATLVRQDRRTAWACNDWPLAQAACRELEDRYDLVRVARPGQASRNWPTSAETHKATRTGRPTTAREELRRRVRAAATAALDEHDFFARLTVGGAVQVQLRASTRNPGETTGYSVALVRDTKPDGDPIFYGGAKLAAADLLTATATAWEGTTGGPLTQAAELFDRAAHEPTPTTTARIDGRGYPLRTIARLVNTTRTGTASHGQREVKTLLRLIAAMASLADALTDLHTAHQRLHQAHAARAAATTLRSYTPPSSPEGPTPSTTHARSLATWLPHQPGPRRHR